MGGEKKEREGVWKSFEKWTFEMRASFFSQLSSVTGMTTERCLATVSVSSWAPGTHQEDESNSTHNDSY